MRSLRPDSPSERDPTPAEADAELLRLAGELTPEKIERLATIADRADEEVATREMPEADGWTAENRDEIIAGWRHGRRWVARTAMRPGESGDDWRERMLHEEPSARHLVIPARRAEDVVEVDLLTLRRRDRRRLFKPKSGKHARSHVLGVVRRASVGRARRTLARPAARRPRRRSGASSSRAGPDDDSGEPEPPAGVVGGTEPRRAWRADTWTRWRCCPECSAVLEYVAGDLWCPRAACPLHDVRHPPADPGEGR